ncbi:MAG TPA: SPFH domain-containing protein [Polyangiaceae bacterium]|nr:SPFH domain-containing protein [Polyangiaceae bacterium]
MRTSSITGLFFVGLGRRARSTPTLACALLGVVATCTGCAGALVQPGHRALLFDPGNGGIQHEVLQPGWYRLACPFYTPDTKCPRVDDFDVTYSTSKEAFHALSKEGLPLDLHIAVAYRPIVSELYLLDTEIGPNYFDEVIGPEFRSAAIGVFAHTSYQDLQRKNGAIEDQIEQELRRRLRGKHVEISSVLIEKVNYDPKILEAQRERVVSQEEMLAKKQLDENKAAVEKRRIELQTEEIETRAAHRKTELAAETEQKKLELQADAEQKKLAALADLDVKKIQIQKDTDEEKFRVESQLRNKKAEKQLTIEQAQIDKMKADADAAAQVAKAKGDSTARLALAKADAAEAQATAANITTNEVMMHAYDALGKLGGTGTTFLLGDWSKLPNWLFPRINGFQTAPFGAYPYMTLPSPGTDSKVSQNDTNPYSAH